MTGFANPLCRLAPRTSSLKCALSPQNAFSTTSNRIPKALHRRSRFHLMIGLHHHRRKNTSQKHSLKCQMLFNIHNPNEDHRDRGKRLRLPSYP
jgi:hypothetical protein